MTDPWPEGCNLVLMQNPDPEHLERGNGRAVILLGTSPGRTITTAAEARELFGVGSWLGERVAWMLDNGGGPVRLVADPGRAGRS